MFVVAAAVAHATSPRRDPFAVSWSAASLAVKPGARFETAIVVTVPTGHYLYADELDVEFVSLEGIHVDDISYPQPVVMPVGGVRKDKRVYRENVRITIVGHVPASMSLGERDLMARVSYQGCTEEVCYRPRTKKLDLAVRVGGQTVVSAKNREDEGGLRSLIAHPDVVRMLDRGLFWTLALVFLAGLLSSLTPCVWPVLPVTLVVIGIERQHSVLRNALLAASLVAGLVIVYAALGISAVALGRNLGFVFQQKWFLVLVVLFFVAMSLSLFGVFEVHLSRRWAHAIHRLGGKGFRGAFLSGMGLGLIASPCTGPVIAGLLGYAALTRSYVAGFAMLVVFGLGMGTLIIVVGAIYGVVADRLRGGVWMVWIKRALGVILLIPAAFYIGSLIGPERASFNDSGSKIAWVEDVDDALEIARDEGKPVMLDFYADWCPPCRRLDRGFFNREDIAQLSADVVPVRIDATRESSRIRRFFERFQVVGMPAFVFLSPDGIEYKALRVMSANGRRLEKSMREAIQRARNFEEGEEE